MCCIASYVRTKLDIPRAFVVIPLLEFVEKQNMDYAQQYLPSRLCVRVLLHLRACVSVCSRVFLRHRGFGSEKANHIKYEKNCELIL